MTLPARARRFTIGNLRLRWLVSSHELPRSLSLWIQHESGTGARVEARLDHAFAVSSSSRFRQTSIVSSALVRRAVTTALEQGWDPHRPGPDRRIHLSIDTIAAARWFHNPEPLLVPFERCSSPRVQSLSAGAFPRAKYLEAVVEADGAGQGSGLFVVLLRDRALGRLWADVFREDDFLRDVLERELPIPVGTLDAPLHEIEQGGETLCWSAGEDIFVAASGGEHFDAAATHQRPFDTWFKVNRTELATAWHEVVGELRRHLPQSMRPARI